MLPKADPYSTKAQKSIDALLLVFTILVIAFVFHTARPKRNVSDRPDTIRTSQSQQALMSK